MSTTNILDLNNRIDELEKNSGGYVLPTATASRLGGVKIGSGISVEEDGTISASGASADSAKRSDIATEFSDATAYTAGCFVYHEGTLYQFNADHAAGTWDPTDVVAANVTDQVVSNKAYIDGVDEDLGEITDNLNGFKFYPAGTAIVGLVSDDSPYTDADGNYILADSTTGQSMIDGVTYKSINSTIDARGKVGADSATPFKSGGGSDEEPTLLWTNSDPTAGFSPQTVALDLTSYKTIGILYRSSASASGQTAFAFYPMGANITIPTTISGYPNIINAGYGQTTSMKATGRNITISSTGIVFGNGYSAESGASNNYGIPVKIYGIKAQIYPTTI